MGFEVTIFYGAGGRQGRAVMAKWNILGGANRAKLNKPSRIKLNKPGRLLVFESTGFALYGALAGCGISSSFTISKPAISTAVDFAAAVGEVLEQLRRQTNKKRLPKTTVLVTSSAAGELLSLPVNPKKPRPKAQMSEMVRWELEEMFALQGDIWSLGALLMGKGYIDGDRRRAVETAETAGKGPRIGGGVYAEMVTREQFDECLTLQEQLTGSDDELITGWSCQGGGEEEGSYTWYCAGIGDGIRSQWARAFKKHGLFLAWIYPQLGAALPLIAPEREGGWLLVDIRQEQFGLFQGNKGRLNLLSIKPCRFGTVEPKLVAETVQELLHPDSRTVYLSAPADLGAEIFAELEQELGERGVEVSVIGEAGAGDICPPPVLASLRGAALHALQLSKPGVLVRIEAQEPKTPGWKRREPWPWVAIALLAASLGGFETYMRVQTSKNKWQLELLDIEYDRKMKIKTEAQATANEVKRLEKELADKEHKLKELERQRDILNNVVRYRQELVPGILMAIGGAVNDEVVVDMIEERANRSGFTLEGWALRDTEGQLFVSRLNEALAPWKYKVEDLKLTRGKGRLDIDGFLLKVALRKVEGKGEQK
jgi:hypothetical protein